MSLAQSANTLSQATKDLQTAWAETRQSWRDVKSDQFAHRYLESLPTMVSTAGPIMEELDALIRKVRHDCE